jgi:hypothetical protein
MMIKRLFILTIIIFFCGYSFAQRPFEVGILAGGSLYHGDIARFYQSGLRPGLGITANYSFQLPVAVRANIIYAKVAAKDKIHPESKINFKSPVFEYSVQFEYLITRLKSRTKNYSIKSGKRGYSAGNFPAITYVFIGFGQCIFNPKGKYTDGNWYNLQPLSTEGQGLIETREPYKKMSLIVPYGAGIRMPVKQGFYLGFEIGIRKTYTDYLDDVSLTYVNNDLVRTQRGDIAAYFADPAQNPDNTSEYPAVSRGNPKYKDAYIFSFVSLSYDFPKPKRTTKFKL